MSQESISLSGEAFQQSASESVDHQMVDSDDHEGTSHVAEQFGIGLSAGILLGGIIGVVVNSLALGVLFGLVVGVVLGLVVMERR